MTHHVTIQVTYCSAPDTRLDFFEAPKLLPFPFVNVNVEFLHRMNGARIKKMTLVMEGRNRGCEDMLRDELLQSVRQDFEWYGEGVRSDRPDGNQNPDEWIIEIIDPHGVLKWLGIDATAVETFKNSTKNDKPLRLPAADSV